MKYSRFFIPTLREAPADAVIASHILMLRAGLVRKLSNGLFAYLPLGLRVMRKLESIIRSGMEAAGSLEIKPTVVVPAEFWKESGRWEAMGESLLRVKNRQGMDFVVSPTAEEAFTALVRGELFSYKQLPLNFYQINTKYRDEIRPRYGLMRAREFIMKDAYSFHANDESLDEAYKAMGQAYRRIFKSCALNVIPVRADSGAMGGSGSEEFMVESEIGDNTLLICPECEDAANVEKASCRNDFELKNEDEARKAASAFPPPEIVDTPGVKTISELEAFFKGELPATRHIKTLVYHAANVEHEMFKAKNEFFAVCIRGDLELNEAKLAALLKAGEVTLAAEADVERLTGASIGFAGPVGLKQLPVIACQSAAALFGALSGANLRDKHYKNVCYGRDWQAQLIADLRVVKAGDRCVKCGAALYEKKGNELGHIFKLGKKYTLAMKLNYLDEAGVEQTPTMGCYGIGLDRTIAAVIEEHHDEHGIIWPMTLAPFHVVVIPIQNNAAVEEAALKLCAELESLGVEVLLDDRTERPGVRFNDADLMGIPFRVVIGEKNLLQAKVEVKRRGEASAKLIDAVCAAEQLALEVKKGIDALKTGG
ncbi:MAG: proline--tRNA ligase [Termitinemataceae bacterium]|nr:MAG: proline--tRNA ligase [Termitinemataceae bacterium]